MPFVTIYFTNGDFMLLVFELYIRWKNEFFYTSTLNAYLISFVFFIFSDFLFFLIF